MVENERQIFDGYTKQCGSPYIACNLISSKARELAERNNNIIMHSEAISWVLSDIKPQILSIYEKNKQKYRNSVCITVTQEVLELVSDSEVTDAVESSIRQSRREKHLIYMYKDITDAPRQSRVRVLCNIIWDKLQTI